MRKVERGAAGYYKPGSDRIGINQRGFFKGTTLMPEYNSPLPHEMVDHLTFFSNFIRYRIY